MLLNVAKKEDIHFILMLLFKFCKYVAAWFIKTKYFVTKCFRPNNLMMIKIFIQLVETAEKIKLKHIVNFLQVYSLKLNNWKYKFSLIAKIKIMFKYLSWYLSNVNNTKNTKF